MVTVTNFASFAWTVCMDDLTRDDAHGKTKSMGSLTFLKTMVTLCPQIKVPLIAVCLDLLQIFILQKGFSFSQIGWNRMVLSIGNSFPRICHVLVHLSSGKSRHPFKRFTPAITRIFHTWWCSSVFWKVRNPCFSFCVDLIGIGIDHHFIPSTLNILVDSAKKERILNTTETKFRVFSRGKSQRCEHVLRSVSVFWCLPLYELCLRLKSL